MYDLFEKEAYAQILFVTHASVICLLLSAEDVEKDHEAARETDAGGEITEPMAHYERKKFKIGFRP